MSRWSLRTDIRLVRWPACCTIAFLALLLLSNRLSSVYAVNMWDTGVWIGTKLLFYFQFVMSFFVIVLTSALFEETCRPKAYTYLRTLPLTVWKMWILRYLRLLLFLYCLTIPAMLVSIRQVNAGIAGFCASFDRGAPPYFSGAAAIRSCVLAYNVYIFATLVAMVLLKNRIFANALLFAYNVMELGPWGSFLGEKAVFYGRDLLPTGSSPLPNTLVHVALLLLLFAIFYLWYAAGAYKIASPRRMSAYRENKPHP